MNISKKGFFLALLVLVVGVALGMKLEAAFSSDDTFEQLKKLEDAFLIVDRQYVEKMDPKVIAESAIAGMLQSLDPHSTFITAEEVAEVQEGYRGSFGGIGIWFEPAAAPEDTAKVTSTIPDGPSEILGIMAGDRIVAINDSSAIGMNSNAIQKRLKGPVGTTVKMTVTRRGARKPIDYVITRGRIPLYSIDSAYMIDEQTGYIRIGRFAMSTHAEFAEKLQALKDSGMKRLLLDLRDNPGGIKSAAVGVADELIGGGRTIVFTRGRNSQENEVDRSTSGGLFEDEPAIVLVNQNSASGSEIVAGALQDQDRALVVGRRTFGKALVQRPFSLSDGSILQITVSRYFTPSGRLIQTPYETGHIKEYYKQKFATLEEATFDPKTYLMDIPDSLKFNTVHGRTVFGGGGVMPDFVIAPDSTSPVYAPLVRSIRAAGLDVQFIREWFGRHETSLREEWKDRKDAYIRTFELNEDMWNEFWVFAEEKGLVLVETPSDENQFTPSDAAADRAVLETLLKARLAQRLYRSDAAFPIYNQIDPEILEAMKLWDKANELTALQR